jgi:SAM-dependent methyltransferase
MRLNDHVDDTAEKTTVSGPVFSVDGFCPVCERHTKINAWSSHFRDTYLCGTCGSLPRERALMVALTKFFPSWKSLRIHESSPAYRGVSKRLREECGDYTETQFHPSVPTGTRHPDEGWRCENLEEQTFDDASFDLVVTQDVFEHVLDPDRAFREIYRTLKPGGAHLATTPLVFGNNRVSVRCAKMVDGRLVHLRHPEYHRNPVDKDGSLVTFWWGYDIVRRIDAAAPFTTLIFLLEDKELGVIGPLNEVIVSFRH